MVGVFGICNKFNILAGVRYIVVDGEMEKVSYCVAFVGKPTLANLSTYENHSKFLLHNFAQPATCLIMIYNGKKEATTGLKKPHRQTRDLGYI